MPVSWAQSTSTYLTGEAKVLLLFSLYQCARNSPAGLQGQLWCTIRNPQRDFEFQTPTGHMCLLFPLN